MRKEYKLRREFSEEPTRDIEPSMYALDLLDRVDMV